ncbi:ribonuclease HII [Allocoprobacillus halotolerans]|uniref:Ribonuclease HII n=1 Tax=Allocoprobacillus halotolerans TaxID=2944914 RepID=A0ABY5I0E7_9FIRM|nr:ribonuclease HII [Allocoprobacillus halotolerans]UTY38525.1 ribonuclease HII [Allocoprobacillus halotolerans]
MCERLKFEQEAYALGKKYIVGLDEAGRGPMAGPLVVGAVIFPQGYYNEKINDSKKLTEKKREALYDVIIQDALAYQIEIIDVEMVDRLNVYQASKKGMLDAIQHLSIQPDYALTDAMPLGDVIEHQSIIKGDGKSLSIGAASILAKVTRDRIMNEYAQIYPEYGFEKHKGYPTKQHKVALKRYGVTPIHRRSFQPVIDVLNQQLSLFDDEI